MRPIQGVRWVCGVAMNRFVLAGLGALACVGATRPAAAADIPVIGVSGRSSTEEEARAHAAGMSGYLAKPISPSKLNTYLSALAAP